MVLPKPMVLLYISSSMSLFLTWCFQVDIACLDLSFISVLKVMPAVVGVLKPEDGVELVVLIKPQFEAGHAQVGSGGVVRDPKV
jgi:predicted rRNA methylase YqxC with S4 and FtsJ domains